MIKLYATLLGLVCLFCNLNAFAQRGTDPALSGRDLKPAPLDNVGSVFSMTFTLGNNGAVPIAGDKADNRMGFAICLSKCKPATTNPMDALSGDLFDYFNITFNPVTGCINGIQKSIPISAASVFDIVISAVVTQASSFYDIGASCTIAPNVSAGLQPTDNDFSSIYTRTNITELPVSLVNFTVNAQQDHTALLNWSTSWERDNHKYVVERSKDLTHFEAVGEVSDVAGTSNSISSYQFVDASPYRGTSYYRLRQVDHSGSSQTFDARSVVIDGQYGVYPNPIVNSGGFTLQLDEPETAGLHLYSITGSETGLVRKTAGDQQVQINPATSLAPGLYILKVQERGAVREHRLMIQP